MTTVGLEPGMVSISRRCILSATDAPNPLPLLIDNISFFGKVPKLEYRLEIICYKVY